MLTEIQFGIWLAFAITLYIVSYLEKDIYPAIASGTIFFLIGLSLLTNGIYVPAGFSSNSTTIDNQTFVQQTTTYINSTEHMFGMMLLLLAIYVIAAVVFSNRDLQKGIDDGQDNE